MNCNEVAYDVARERMRSFCGCPELPLSSYVLVYTNNQISCFYLIMYRYNEIDITSQFT